MKICLYNSPGKIAEGSFDKIIWCPLSEDIVHIVRFFRENYGKDLTLTIESVFGHFLTNETGRDITYFDIEKPFRNTKERMIAFYSQSDTLAGNTLRLISGDPGYKYINYVPSGRTENADVLFEKNNVPFIRYSYRHLKQSRPDILVLYNDWTKAAIRIISHCHLLGIHVVCIQESIVDFNDSFRRMQHADDLMIQGIKSVTLIPRRNFYLTGNPRYYCAGKTFNEPQYVLINCNFTYNIHEGVRSRWLDDITSALDEPGINYLISRHPRDKGDLSKYKNVIRSSSTSLDEQFGKAGLLITRFSSLIHESLIRGVPVIYYNPHGEEMHYDFEFNPDFLAEARDTETLKKHIASLYKKNISGKNLELYLDEHCLPAATKPVSNINQLLAENNFSSVRFTLPDLFHLILYQPFMLCFARKIRQFLSETPESEN
jgi:hypothetical protein